MTALETNSNITANTRRNDITQTTDSFRPDRRIKVDGPGLRVVKQRWTIPMATEDGTDKERSQVKELREALKAAGYLEYVRLAQEPNCFVVTFSFQGVFSSDDALMNHLYARLEHIIANSDVLQKGFCEKPPKWTALKGKDDAYKPVEQGFFKPQGAEEGGDTTSATTSTPVKFTKATRKTAKEPA